MEAFKKNASNSRKISDSDSSNYIQRPLSACHHFYRFQKDFFKTYRSGAIQERNSLMKDKKANVPSTSKQMRVVITKMWKTANKETKKKFKTMSKLDKKRFQKELSKLPPYKYVDHVKDATKICKIPKVHNVTHYQPILADYSVENAVDTISKNDYFIDTFGIKWSIGERKFLCQMSSYLEKVSDESFERYIM